MSSQTGLPAAAAAPAGFAPASIRLVVFDMAGTTVDDGGAGGSLVVAGMLSAFQEEGLLLSAVDVAPWRGREKRDAIRQLLRRATPGLADEEPVIDRIATRFLAAMEQRVRGMREMPGTTDVFRFLRTRNISVALGSGFPHALIEILLRQLGWAESALIDYVGCSETLGAGRPDPAMILSAMTIAGLTDPAHVLKVGDTVADVQEGRNAGAWTAVVLSGSQPRTVLEAAGPDFVLNSVADLPGLFA